VLVLWHGAGWLLVVVPSLPSGYSGNAGAYAASIVLDRQLVKPGDELHVTGEGE
jgi:hypothetical protein